ncbi:MAG: hypothetical protein M5U26_26665 [Planctomycetota bacterium]|nr:hypothetical protein [Planctomycetota bacterium]
MNAKRMVLILLAACALCGARFAACQDAEPAPAPLPEGPGLAAKFVGDAGIEQDPAVVFADGFENDRGNFDNGWGGIEFVTQPENVHGGKKSLEMKMVPPKPGGETSLGVQKHFRDRGYDTLHVRYYAKFEKTMDMLHHNHNNCCIAARAPGVPDAKPGIPADGRNEFTIALETWRSDDRKADPPGELNIYCYHPAQRSQWGDHFFPTGLITPQPKADSPKNLFGKHFAARPNLVPERDRWACYELMVQANTPGKLDGRIAYWVDGRLAADFPNLRLRDVPELKANRFGFGMSTRNAKDTHVNTMWFDDVVAATSYIGPRATAPAPQPPPSKPAAEPAAQPKPAGPTPEQQARAKERYAELKTAILAEVAKGRREAVFVDVLGKLSKVQVVAADEKALNVSLQGNRFPLAWDDLPAEQFFNVASQYGANKVALHEYCLGMGLERQAEQALLRR